MTIHSAEPRSVAQAAFANGSAAAATAKPAAYAPPYAEPKSAKAAEEFAGLLALDGALLRDFVAAHHELEAYKSGAPIPLSGGTLTLPAVAAVARYPGLVSGAVAHALDALAADPAQVFALERSRRIIDAKLAQNKSIYGVSTGFGGSGASSSSTASPLPLTPPLSTTSMPPAWVRAALLIRLNSLLRGHSAASLPLLSAMAALLAANVTPVVPLRGSISASGDLSPLSYVAGALVGERGIFCWAPAPAAPARGLGGPAERGGFESGDAVDGLRVLRAPDALAAHGLTPVSLRPKEHLAILNGTAFSCGVAALCVEEARQMVLLGMVCTALGTEALRGSADSFCAFVQAVRPHPGQVEAGALLTHLLAPSALASHHAEEETIDADAGTLRQDRYPLRTAPQWLGPQAELVQRAAEVIRVECNSTTDNPLIDPATGIVHHGGNFQAMAVTAALEPLRLALAHVGKLLFAQSTELLNSGMNGGLPGNLAATDPSLNFFGKGIDIAQAAYVAELAYLANPVSTGVQSAEMHNQAVNSLAFVSARYTLQALDVLQLLTASYLYLLCQAVDLRALQRAFEADARRLVRELLATHLGGAFAAGGGAHAEAQAAVADAVWAAFDASANMDAAPRTEKAARASTQPLSALARALHASYTSLGRAPGAPRYQPAAPLLGRTRGVYAFVRGALRVGMHGRENLGKFAGGLSRGNGRTIGGEVALVYEAIRDGRMRGVLVAAFEGA
ncbi:phenylalanine ammonia-lyase [Phellopilus nigrolimitatus]|nr:phenylalanine ammonia-lyase [Phellopilus nigrolimitatus]